VGALAGWLDGLFTVPGTRMRVGLDSLLGLIPGVGDVAGLVLGGVIFVESLRVGAPRSVLARMLANLVVDAVGGAVPVLGDLFDFGYRAHARNAKLLLDHLDEREAVSAAPAPARSKAMAVLVIGLWLGLLGLAATGAYLLIAGLIRWLVHLSA
jgi:hypothetical protein